MEKYKIIIYKQAEKNLNDIYQYITYDSLSPESAKKETDKIVEAILSLETFPQSHQERLHGKYANKGFRQLIINNYIIIYKINEQSKSVYIYLIIHHRRKI